MFENVKGKFFPVSEEKILKAEKRMGIHFPKDLLQCYRELGYGFVTNPERAINRLMDPGSCADVRLREDYFEFDPDLEMYEPYEKDELLFFENNEGVYISIGLNDNKIYFAGDLIADSIVEFLEKIVDPDFWHKSK